MDYHLEQGSENGGPWTKFNSPPVFVNKVLMEDSHSSISMTAFTV